ncbi:retrovirus-related pol polyprotein from transposon TNT 1-94 [Tanacetum coccineum]
MDKNAKDFLKLVEEKFCSTDKAIAGTLMAELTILKFDGSKSMQQYVLDMTNTTTRLKTLGMHVDDSFLVKFIMSSLPPEYGPFHINYNIIKDKWTIDELSSKLIQEEARLNKQRVYSVNLVNQGVDKKLKPKSNNFKKKQHGTTSKVANGENKEQQNNKCNFCKKEGYFQKDCPKRKAWFKKKDSLQSKP